MQKGVSFQIFPRKGVYIFPSLYDRRYSLQRNTLADGLIETTSSMLDETESKTVNKDEEGDR